MKIVLVDDDGAELDSIEFMRGYEKGEAMMRAATQEMLNWNRR